MRWADPTPKRVVPLTARWNHSAVSQDSEHVSLCFNPCGDAPKSLDWRAFQGYASHTMLRRQTKLQFYEHPVTCPYCGTDIWFTSLMEHITMSWRNCLVCKREMLIEDGRAVRIPGEGGKKPHKRLRSHISQVKD